MMFRKAFNRWGYLFFFIAFSQCTKCKRPLFEDLTKRTLAWQEVHPLNTALPDGLDLIDGITCYVPKDSAVYFVNPTGDCWKFTQTEAGPTHESIDKFPDSEQSSAIFAFAAGTTLETQALHVGAVTDEAILLHKYTDKGWENIDTFDLADFEVGNVPDLHVVACSVHDEDEKELQGLVALQTEAKENLTMLVYDPSIEALSLSEDWHYQYPNRKPMAIVELAPKRAMMLYRRNDGKLGASFMHRELNFPVTIVKDVPTEDKITRSALFVLRLAEQTLKRTCLILHRTKEEPEEHEVPQFYTLQDLSITAAENLPTAAQETQEEGAIKDQKEEDEGEQGDDNDDEEHFTDHSASLVLPFKDQVYFITQNDKEELVYYVGTLNAPQQQKATP